MNRVEAMQIFLRVAELSSFTRTAESLALPKASVSTAVQQLEETLGTRLLHRTTRKVQLTQDGQAYYERCKDVLDDLDELDSMFQNGGEALRGRLRVDMPTGVARNFVLPQLPQFLGTHPAIELELSSTDRRVDLVREGYSWCRFCICAGTALVRYRAECVRIGFCTETPPSTTGDFSCKLPLISGSSSRWCSA